MKIVPRLGLPAAFLAACVLALGISVGRLDFTPEDSQSLVKDSAESSPAAKDFAAPVMDLAVEAHGVIEPAVAGRVEESATPLPAEAFVSARSSRAPPHA